MRPQSILPSGPHLPPSGPSDIKRPCGARLEAVHDTAKTDEGGCSET